jgi:hypothetical protein
MLFENNVAKWLQRILCMYYTRQSLHIFKSIFTHESSIQQRVRLYSLNKYPQNNLLSGFQTYTSNSSDEI